MPIRTAGLEATSQVGRGECHCGIFKDHLKHVVKVHKVIGNKGMKMAAFVAIECKNQMMRNGGLVPCQWVLGKFPRGTGHLLVEEEWGQLGVVQGMMDSTTEFGLRSQYRLESRKKLVEQDCSRRPAALRYFPIACTAVHPSSLLLTACHYLAHRYTMRHYISTLATTVHYCS